ncbi:SH3 domain-containing protein [Lentibacter sp. XHP0401]|jgi:SH3-like domain-containing protein|uniref:SH3 domain-containing protein n=1 Tax=Lentibacter sp. XHP0401 TaxID=2984334 RepID=UPI0021E84D12|nr:SH3 domain-containing protein [Lentibacter sp. XHP0401]MCV2893680.1 SH3 domain-containing protein [Lentibacter sp. XHP0401]
MIKHLFAISLAVFLFAGVVLADQKRGSVTNLPIPRFVSIKSDECNVRRGPSLSHKIDWVFKRKGMPVEVTAEYGHWRRVRDRDGVGGWVHYSLLSGARSVIIEEDMQALHIRPDPETQISARLELGVIARLSECTQDWCRLNAGGFKGWAPKATLWGVTPDELIE